MKARLALTALIGAVFLLAGAPAHAAPPVTGKYYVVGAPVNGQPDYLYAIALKTLGDGNRYREIAELNAGRTQPDGGALGESGEVRPGWILVLPEDAGGEGVKDGPLPVITPRAAAPRPAAAPAPRRSAVTGTAVLWFAGFGLMLLLVAAVLHILNNGARAAAGRSGARPASGPADPPLPPGPPGTPIEEEDAGLDLAVSAEETVAAPFDTREVRGRPAAPAQTRDNQINTDPGVRAEPAPRPEPAPAQAHPADPAPRTTPVPPVVPAPTTPSTPDPARTPAPAASGISASASPSVLHTTAPFVQAEATPLVPAVSPGPAGATATEAAPLAEAEATAEAATLVPAASRAPGAIATAPTKATTAATFAPRAGEPAGAAFTEPAVTPWQSRVLATAGASSRAFAGAGTAVGARSIVDVPLGDVSLPDVPVTAASTGSAPRPVRPSPGGRGPAGPKPSLPDPGDGEPDLNEAVLADVGPAGIRLRGVGTSRSAPAYAWLAEDATPMGGTVPLVVGHRDGWWLHVDLGRTPDCLAITGAPDAVRRQAAVFARRLHDTGHGVAVIGGALGEEIVPGMRFDRLPEPPSPGAPPPAPQVVFVSDVDAAATGAARSLVAATGGRVVPVILGVSASARWTLRLRG